MINRPKLAVVVCASLFAFCLAGCSPGVREDRSINYSTEGGSVAFQHGDEGVFVASADGQSLERIFDSMEVLATSSPLWSPVDQRLIFTTVEPLRDANQAGTDPGLVVADWEAFPDGRPFYAGQMEYTCWLAQAPSQDATTQDGTSQDATQAEPKPLFTARCNHSGYVAANLAVRWHPSGQQIVFVDQVDEVHMGLFVFDLQSSTRKQVMEKVAQTIVFAWSPRGNYLSASLHGVAEGTQHDGVWLLAGQQLTAPETAWWHIPGSDQYETRGWREPLELLRRSQPVWNQDESKLAYPLSRRVASGQELEHNIAIAQPASREVGLLLTTSEPLRDLRWHPDGKRLGFIEGGLQWSVVERDDEDARRATWKIVDQAGVVSEPLADSDAFATNQLRQFVGWNASGEQMAVVAPIAVEEYQHKWAVLFPAIPSARDRVLLLDTSKTTQPHIVHEGMRITFPQWSPTANQLSLWGTFTPTHRSWLSIVLPASLRPGDPAAILDAETGQLSWLAINQHERSQVGHYYLLKQDYARAWEWYSKGAEGRAEPQPQSLQNLWSQESRTRFAQEPWFFEYYCLFKLGRHDEAQTRLANFRRSMSFQLPREGEELLNDVNPSDPMIRRELQQTLDLLTPLIQASLAAEVFLSLNASDDGVQFFRQQYTQATNDAERFAAAICLTQMLLATGDHVQYATFVTDELLPFVERLTTDKTLPGSLEVPNANDIAAWREQAEWLGLLLISGMSCLPLASAEFQATLDEALVRELLPVWQAFAQRSPLPVDAVVIAMLQRLGQDTSDAVARSAEKEPWLPGRAEFQWESPQQVDDMIVQLSQLFQQLSRF
jgi:hypothetical protein